MNRKQTLVLALTLGTLVTVGAQAADSAPSRTPATPSGPAAGPNAPVINNPTTITPGAAVQPNGKANPAHRTNGGGVDSEIPSQDGYDRESRNQEMPRERQQGGQDMINERQHTAP